MVGQAYSQPAAVDPNDPSTWAPITLTPTTPGQPNGQPPSGAVGFNGGLPGRGAPNQVQQFPGNTGAPGQTGVPGQTGIPGQPNIAGQTVLPGQPGFPGAVNGIPGQVLPGQPGFNPNQNQFRIDQNGQLVPITPQQPGQTGATQNGTTGQPAAGTNTAAPGVTAPANVLQNINQMLTNPTPAGTGLPSFNMSSSMVTGGLAGVATTYKGASIKIYNDRQKYQEWEFVYKLNNGQNGAPGQTPAQGANGQNGQNPGNPQAPPTSANSLSGVSGNP